MKASRRGFIQGCAAGAAALSFGGCASFGKCNGKIRLAAVGIMGKGFSDWFPMIKSGLAELVALCDADANQLARAQAALKKKNYNLDLSKIPFYTDYRKMFDDQVKLNIQAMTVSTPDHMHAAIAITGMKLGIHCYVQKPLVRTLWEAKYFADSAKKYGIITQMGNQGSGGDGFRRNVEVVQQGVLGNVKEVHVWTNRPVWPQGLAAMKAACTHKVVAVPEGLDWNAWLGVAAGRPYRAPYEKGTPAARFGTGLYHAFNWRGFFDFGAGAFGDMACHTMNLPFRGLELGKVTDAECTMVEELNNVAYPTKSIVKLTYAARESKVRKGVKLPEVKLFWYDGNVKPSADLMPQICAMEKYNGKVPNTGCLIIGDKGILCSCNDYGQQSFIALKGEKVATDVNNHEACKTDVIKPYIPRRSDIAAGGMDKSDGAAALAADGHYIEFLDAINGNGPVSAETNSRCYADYEYSIPMMEAILVGTVAQQVPGKLAWNSCKQLFDNDQANTLIKPVIRSGFEF